MTHPIEVQGGRGLEEKPQRNLASQVARSQPAHKHCCLGTKSAPPDSAKCPGTFSSQGYVEGCFSCCSAEAGGPARSWGHGTGPAAKQGPVGEGRAEQDRSGDHSYASSPACPPRPPRPCQPRHLVHRPHLCPRSPAQPSSSRGREAGTAPAACARPPLSGLPKKNIFSY